MTTAILPPYDAEAEAAVVGACILNRDVIVAIAPIVRPEMFYLAKHAEVYRAVLDCYQRRVPPDIRTVSDALRKIGAMERVGGMLFLSELTDAAPTSAHAEHYARIVARYAERRGLIEAGARIAALGYRDDLEVDGLRSEALSTLSAAAQVSDDGGFTPIGDVFNRQWDQMSSGRVVGVPTGYYDLDRLIGGFAPGNLILLAAISGGGKSALALSLAWNFARQGRPVGYVSLEMSEDELGQRIIAQETGIDTIRQRSANLDTDDLQKIIRLNGERAEAPLYVEDKTPLTAAELRSRVLRLHAQRGPLELVVVDYLGLLSMDTRRATTAQAMNQVSQDIKNLAKELRCPVLLLTQLNREIYHREDKRPKQSDIREAGEAAADYVIVIHREAAFNPNAEQEMSAEELSKADLYLVKSRSAPQGMVTLGYDGKRTLFYNREHYRGVEGY